MVLLAVTACVPAVLGRDTSCQEVFCGLSQPLQTGAGIVPQTMQRQLPSKFFPVYHSSVILRFDTLWSKLMAGCVEHAHS
jgi:hypothetical protein